jgi:hypothetical protein
MASPDSDEHLYYTQDANFNVTVLLDVFDGGVVERYRYEPYGYFPTPWQSEAFLAPAPSTHGALHCANHDRTVTSR